MAIEEVLSSRGRIRILKVLARERELNISEIARRAGLNYTTTRAHLDALENAGIVRHRRFGRIRLYQFNNGNQKAETLRRLLEVWGE